LADVHYLTNVSILELDTLPDPLVGGSYIALELAQMYRRFGAEVTVVERGSRLASREDPCSWAPTTSGSAVTATDCCDVARR
jgi:pyruvate/2-oxoglutarate dehydrogenase complex dihydrolipoamide dehydrogenase (E3) component